MQGTSYSQVIPGISELIAGGNNVSAFQQGFAGLWAN
jgi:hypothetical protein